MNTYAGTCFANHGLSARVIASSWVRELQPKPISHDAAETQGRVEPCRGHGALLSSPPLQPSWISRCSGVSSLYGSAVSLP